MLWLLRPGRGVKGAVLTRSRRGGYISQLPWRGEDYWWPWKVPEWQVEVQIDICFLPMFVARC